MQYTRDDYRNFLQTELVTQEKNFDEIVNTRASVLKERGVVFVGMFVGTSENGMMVFKVRQSDNMPRKNSFWTASYLIGDMGKYKNWGDLSWSDLRCNHQKAFSDAMCAWIAKSKEPDFCIVGIKGLTIDFVSMLESGNTIIAFGPKDPPIQYLYNLIQIVGNTHYEKVNEILDYDGEHHFWNPQKIDKDVDLAEKIKLLLAHKDRVVIQGPPGTGKTYRMAQLAARLLGENNSVLVTALTNQALMELAKKEHVASFLRENRVYKTSLTVDESKELPAILPVEDNKCNAARGRLTLASFYVASGWAAEMSDVPFDYVIMDEASQALYPMIAASAKLGRKVIWIGDQNQLSPIIETNEDVINSHGWGKMLNGFETICDDFKFDSYMLCDTFRMTERGAYCTGAFYNDSLRSVAKISPETSSNKLFNAKGGPVLVNFDFKVGDKSPQEAFSFIFHLVTEIRNENKEAEVAVLAKFRETVRNLQKYFVINSKTPDIPEKVKIETVDRVQGLTVDFCIFLIPNALVEFSLEKALFNVATSRAKNNTIIVSDKSIMTERMSTEVRQYLERATMDNPPKMSPETRREIRSGSVGVTVVNKIDLSKFETPRQKAVKSTDKKNIYIIDTNVFVDYPDILSRIDTKYQVVLSAKVIDELDKLKIKLDDDGKRNVEKALKNINRALDAPNVSMELSDISLLPSDFNAKSPDNNILTVALKFKDENPILLTSDNGLQVKAKGMKLATISLKEFLKH